MSVLRSTSPSQETVDKRLLVKNIKMLEKYKGNKDIHKFKCLKCETEWETKLCNLFQQSGCPKCKIDRSISKEIIFKNLEEKQIKIISEYRTTKTLSEFECLKCQYKWKQFARPIVIGKSSCPNCRNKRKLVDQKVIENKLLKKNVKLLDEYKGYHHINLFRCLTCDNEWKNKCENLLGISICPKCKINNRNIKNNLTKEKINERLIGRKIELLVEYTKNYDRLLWKCLECSFEWLANSNNILDQKCGCPKCVFKKRGLGYRNSREKILNTINSDLLELLDLKEGFGNIYKVKCKECEGEWEKEARLLVKGVGCPFCNCGYNENLARRYLKELFPNIYIKKNFYIKENIIVKGELIRNFTIVDFRFILNDQEYWVEYNGEQHYKPVPMIGNKTIEQATERFRKQKLRDDWIREQSIIRGIKLIEIDGRTIKGKKILDYLKYVLPIDSINFDINNNTEQLKIA